jgi:hypothetical protein
MNPSPSIRHTPGLVFVLMSFYPSSETLGLALVWGGVTQESYIPALSNVDTGVSGRAYHAGRLLGGGGGGYRQRVLKLPINGIIYLVTNACPSHRLCV